MAIVDIRGARKTYPGAAAETLKGIDCTVADGEFLVILGPSGCGKSTLLRMVAGLERISAGEIAIGGRIVNNLEPKDRDIAMVFQNYALYPHMSVYDNMAYGLKIRRLPRAEIDRRVREAAALLGLSDYLKRKPRQLSGGQRQRVAMGRAIVREPAAFLFDEPLSNLDAKLRTQMRVEIKKLQRRLAVTSLYVTHDQVEAMTLADKIVVLRGGKVEQVGSPMQLYDDPDNRFVAGFIGSPAMNLLPGEIVETGNQTKVHIDGGRGAVLSNYPSRDADKGRKVKVGIRPEDFHPVDGDDWAFSGTVDIAESLGEVTLLYFQKDAIGQQDQVIAKLNGIHSDMRGRTVHMSADPGKVHLFADGLSLLYR